MDNLARNWEDNLILNKLLSCRNPMGSINVRKWEEIRQLKDEPNPSRRIRWEADHVVGILSGAGQMSATGGNQAASSIGRTPTRAT